jgi:hypothetical protein
VTSPDATEKEVIMSVLSMARTGETRCRDVEFHHGRIRMVSLANLIPAKLNDVLYKPVDGKDPEILALGKSIKERGVLEPFVVTSDLMILSGHRRRVGANIAGLTEVPCRVLDIPSTHPDVPRLLREFNRQRVKSLDEVLREEILSVDSREAYRLLREQRERQSRVAVDAVVIRGTKIRSKISRAKRPFLEACQQIINDLRDYWPLSDRRVHYVLCNNPPLIHASKPDSRYRNDLKSYKKTVDLLTRARLEGSIPWQAISSKLPFPGPPIDL